MSSYTPIDEEIASCVAKVQLDQPGIGALKILAVIKQDNPDWSLSEKRLKKVLHRSSESALIARTGLDPTLNVDEIAPKVKVQLFAKGKGKVSQSDSSAKSRDW